MDARNSEPDLGSLLELVEDEPEFEAASSDKHEPRLFAPEKATARRGEDGSGKAGLTLGAADRFGQPPALPSSLKTRRDVQDDDEISLAARALTVWGGFWRAVVIGVVSGSVGGVVGAFTLVWLTGAGWTTFAKLLIDAIGRL